MAVARAAGIKRTLGDTATTYGNDPLRVTLIEHGMKAELRLYPGRGW
jgi:hypothetical protein